MAEPFEESDDSADELSEIKIRYVSSPSRRVVHMDGVWGGLTPNHEIHVSFFSERATFPDSVTYNVDEGRLGEIVGREGEEGLDREMEVDVRMTLRKAISFRNWLDDKINQLEGLPGETTEG